MVFKYILYKPVKVGIGVTGQYVHLSKSVHLKEKYKCQIFSLQLRDFILFLSNFGSFMEHHYGV